MKIFGRGKAGNDTPADDDLDIISDDAGFEDTGTGGGLSAPQRGFGGRSAGSNKKFILLVVLLVVLGGGYVALTMLSEDEMAVAVLPPAQPLGDAPIPVTPVDAAGMPPGVLPADNAPMGDTAAMAPPAMPALPPIDPLTGLPMAPAPSDAAVLPAPATGLDALAPVETTEAVMPPLPDMPPMPDAAASMAATPALPAIDPVTGMPMPAPADTTAAVDPIDAENLANPTPADDMAENAMQAPAPAGTAPGDMPVPVAAAEGMTATDPTTIPAPTDMPAAADPAVIAPVAETTPTAPAAPPAVVALDEAAIAAGAAEQALMDNADLMPPPEENAGARTPEEIAAMWAALPTQPALVRPMPNSYLTVRTEKTADSLDSRLSSARRALNDGRAPAALQFFNELRADYPSDTRVLMGRAVTLQRLGQNAEALQAYEEVLIADPKNLDALTNMLGLLKGQNPAMAVEKLMDLRNIYPYSADITTQLALAYGDGGNMNEALRYITLAEALKPNDSYVLYNKAIIYDRLGRRTEAADMYAQLIRLSADGSLDRNLPIENIKRRLAVMR